MIAHRRALIAASSFLGLTLVFQLSRDRAPSPEPVMQSHETGVSPAVQPAAVLENSETFTWSEEGEVAIRDRDGDGVTETLTRVSDGGSGFWGSTCTISDPSIELNVGMSYFGSFGSFVDVAQEPSDIPHDTFRNALVDCIFGAHTGSDASFDRWVQLARASENARRWHLPRTTWSAPLQWLPGPAVAPTTAVRRVLPDEIELWMRRLFVDGPPENFGQVPIWLRYAGENHQRSGGFYEVARRDNEQLLATSHGVVWVRDEQHAWAFVSDQAWGGPDKLRHSSIDSAGFTADGIWLRTKQADTFFIFEDRVETRGDEMPE